MLQRCDDQDQVVLAGGECEFLYSALMDLQTGAPCRLRCTCVWLNSFQRPARKAEVPKDSKVKAVSAADIENSSMGSKIPAPPEQPLGF
jgi:hypothetical protein